MTQLHWRSPSEAESSGVVLGDVDGDLKRWFDQHPVGVVVLRPDRIIAGAAFAQESRQLADAVLLAASTTANNLPGSTIIPTTSREDAGWQSSPSPR